MADTLGRMRCKECPRESMRLRRFEKPAVMNRLRTESVLRKRYGIDSLEKRDAILASQGGCCAICGTSDCTWGQGFEKKWHIDHDHSKPGSYRAVLCSRCNLIIGKLGDDPDLIEKMTNYLKGHSHVST